MSTEEKSTTDSAQTSEVTSSKKGKKVSPVFIISICMSVIVVVLLCVVIYLLTHPKTAAPVSNGPQRETLITPENVEERIAELEEVTPDNAYTASMNVDWYFDDGASPSSNAYVENYISNPRTMYFEVFLADTNEMVYSSPYVPVGSILEELTLSKDLDKGDYGAIVVYHMVDDDFNELSTVSVSVNLHILN